MLNQQEGEKEGDEERNNIPKSRDYSKNHVNAAHY